MVVKAVAQNQNVQLADSRVPNGNCLPENSQLHDLSGLRFPDPQISLLERLTKLQSKQIEYINSPEFADRKMANIIKSEMPGAYEYRMQQVLEGGDRLNEVSFICASPVLTRAQEFHLFRQMNYYKYLACRRLEKLNPAKVKEGDIVKVEEDLRKSEEVRNQILMANVKLILSRVGKVCSQGQENYLNQVSDGKISLLRAIDKFEFTRLNKFSGYATAAIINNMKRAFHEGLLKAEREKSLPEVFWDSIDHPETLPDSVDETDQLKGLVSSLLEKLRPAERRIVELRYLHHSGKSPTLERIGETVGLTKERVRQILAKALATLSVLGGEKLAQYL